MQKVTLVGNLGKDPEERSTASGKDLITFSLAVKSGKEETVWYDCVIWEKRKPMFQGLIPHLKKGSRVIIGADLKTPVIYESQNGPMIKMSCEPFYINFVGSPEKKESTPKHIEEALPF